MADLVTANAALNLALDKAAALREAARILRPGGRLVAADLVREADLPPEILADPMAHATSLGGAVGEAELRDHLAAAGFEAIAIGGHRPFGPLTAIDLGARKPIC